MHPVKIWVLATRPKTLPISLGPALFGTILALTEGFFNIFTFCMTFATALGLQISANLANDYFDAIKGADTKERKGPLRVTQAGLVSHASMRKALYICFGLTACAGCFLIAQGGIWIALIFILALISAALYTAGPFPLAYIGLGDLFVFMFFGPVAVSGAYFLQTHIFSWNPVLLGIASGALSVTPLIINNLRDRDEDVTSEKKTLIVRFGHRFGQFELLFCVLVAILIPFFFYKDHPHCLLSLLFLVPSIPMLSAIFQNPSPSIWNILLAQSGKTSLLYHVLFCIGWQWR